MKKILLIAFALLLTNTVFAYEVPKNEEYYKSQIQNQRFLYNESGMFNAVTKKNSDVVEMFLKAGFNPNATFTGTPVVMHALFIRDIKSFDILLQYGANPETSVPALWVATKPQNLLSFAIKRKSSEAVKSLIKHKVDVNKSFNGKTPLNYAISTKQPIIVEMLLKAGAKPDEKSLKMVNKSKDEYLKDLFKNQKVDSAK